MSGGHFDYKQYQLEDIADSIERQIQRNGREKTKEEMRDEGWRDSEWFDKYPEERYYYKYPDEVIDRFKEAVKSLRIAAIYTQRIDWLLSGDDGEESFISRLNEELNNAKRQK